MKTVSTVLIALLSLTPVVNTSHGQDTRQFETGYIYILNSLDNLDRAKISTEITVTSKGVHAVTFGDGSAYLYNNICLYKGERKVEEEGRLTRMRVECVSGGNLIVTERPGQIKFAFVNSNEGNEDFFSSGVFYTDFSTNSPEELLLW